MEESIGCKWKDNPDNKKIWPPNGHQCQYCVGKMDKFSDKGLRITELERQLKIHLEYLLVKVEEKDWHGVQDAASDLRDIEAELKGLNFNG